MADDKSAAITVAIADIVPNPFQPRKEFDPEKLRELADSIQEHGLIQPLAVRKVDRQYQLIAGERRWRASKLAGLTTVPVMLIETDDRGLMEMALVENLQREDLNPMEAALAYRRLIDEFDLTQEEVAVRVGRSRPAISNTMRLLTLPEPVQMAVASGEISEGHARALLGLKDPEEVIRLSQEISAQDLSVRATEQAVRNIESGVSRETKRKTPLRRKIQDPDLGAIEDQIRMILGTHVNIKGSNERGTIEIDYYSSEDLTRLLEKIVGSEVG
ncbi:MAG TPA: stage 0 sporulation protein J [Firmicutes bacterium]|nr:stage 0 sporulation protein J [Bacillota bacterium]HAW71025.1 stage 0 sporulation protein J [Bacillota bacterium]HAZ21292.1 stage 0 sporulation protein J [Bacillota bacterium]HBE05264.1 stage 0 sporulation protein J [Bacillota bacterium]HBG44080.1 stage 0 sporulation protein J [Bacillota bacterium]